MWVTVQGKVTEERTRIRGVRMKLGTKNPVDSEEANMHLGSEHHPRNWSDKVEPERRPNTGENGGSSRARRVDAESQTPAQTAGYKTQSKRRPGNWYIEQWPVDSKTKAPQPSTKPPCQTQLQTPRERHTCQERSPRNRRLDRRGWAREPTPKDRRQKPRQQIETAHKTAHPSFQSYPAESKSV